jgi:hypothetical protein
MNFREFLFVAAYTWEKLGVVPFKCDRQDLGAGGQVIVKVYDQKPLALLAEIGGTVKGDSEEITGSHWEKRFRSAGFHDRRAGQIECKPGCLLHRIIQL